MTASLAEARECNRGRKVNADRLTALDHGVEFDTPTIRLTRWMYGQRLTWPGGGYDTPAKVRDW
jgi:hypothetical protein